MIQSIEDAKEELKKQKEEFDAEWNTMVNSLDKAHLPECIKYVAFFYCMYTHVVIQAC